jgi:hypothetical protein
MKREGINVSKIPGAHLVTRRFLGLLLTTFLPVAASIAEAQQLGKFHG